MRIEGLNRPRVEHALHSDEGENQRQAGPCPAVPARRFVSDLAVQQTREHGGGDRKKQDEPDERLDDKQDVQALPCVRKRQPQAEAVSVR